MDRNDQGILRSVVLRITKHLKQAGVNPDDPLPIEIQNEIVDITSRLHNVEAFAAIQLAFDQPASRLKVRVLNLILGQQGP